MTELASSIFLFKALALNSATLVTSVKTGTSPTIGAGMGLSLPTGAMGFILETPKMLRPYGKRKKGTLLPLLGICRAINFDNGMIQNYGKLVVFLAVRPFISVCESKNVF